MTSPVFAPGPTPTTVRDAQGAVHSVPTGWRHLPPGDAALTRRVKEAGPTWQVQERRGRKIFSRGLWAPTSTITRIEAELAAERATPQYARKRAADSRRRAITQAAYVLEFRRAVEQFLDFHPQFLDLASQLAQAVTDHATPVGSAAVARTERIPVERRAEAAVICRLRHHTPAYDSLKIPGGKRERGAVRQHLPHSSRHLVDQYRRRAAPGENCPLRAALASSSSR